MKGIKLKVWKEGKRLLSMALSAALIVGTLAGAAVPVVDVQAAETIATITEDFEDGKSTGYVRGGAPKEVVDEGRNGGKAVKISERGENWHTYAYGVSAYAGMNATVQAYLKTTDAKAICEVTGDAGEGAYYEWMIDNNVTSADEWVLLEGTFEIPAGATELYFSTGGTADYLLDDVKITITGVDPYYYGENLIKNPNFASDDLSDWQAGKGGATITTHTADEAIFDNVKTYATISDRTDSVSGNGECFRQDITDVVESGKTYKYSFWVKLDADDYKNAPAGQREVCFAPGASNGSYWGSYSSGILDANCVKNDITPGEWVKIEGEFTPQYPAGSEVFIRLIEQGTGYGANEDSSVRGDYSVTGVSLCEKIRKAEPEAYAVADMEYEAGNTIIVNEQDGNLEAKIEGNYQSLYFKIPRTVNVKTLEEIEVELECVSSNSVSVNDATFGIKVLTDEQKADYKKEFNGLSAVYGTNKIGNFDQIYEKLAEDDSLGDLKWVAVMTAFPENLPADTWAEIVLKNINFTFSKSGKENYFIEEDLKSLYQAVGEESNISMGVAVPVGALDDAERMNLVYKHYNSVTCENEMKPESLLGKNEPGVSDIEDVVLDFANADKMMDAIVSANNAGVANIKVRGHVLVWHSQTPGWFFREGLKADGAYVTPEVMNERMKWYIDAVLTHFDERYGEDDLFYAWDVVNEAANDAGGPRPNGDWYNVYGKENPNNIEYITNAFKYADETLDKLGDQDMILFYNDYNECTPTKCDTIVGYLEEIRKVIGEERTLGAGMQGHHDMASPTLDTIEAATRAYAAVADVVHITELDIKSSMGFDGVDMEGENTKQAHRYKDIYNMVQRVNEDETLDGKVTNITIWGTHDAASWLKTSNSVGGSADGKTPQFPLLFDDNLKAKPSYWAFVDQDQLESFINDTVAMNTDNFDYATAYEFKAGSKNVTVKPVWNNGKVQFQISLSEALGADDKVTVFFDPDNSKSEGDYKVAELTAKDFNNKVAVVDAKVDAATGMVYSFDVRVNAGGVDYSYNDLNNTQDKTSKYYARVSLKPFMEISKGTIKVDGDKKEWANVPTVELNVIGNTPEAKGTAKVLWDEENLYVLMDVKDSALDATATFSTNAHEHDSMEVFIDELNEKAGSYDNNDKQYRVNYLNAQSFNGPTCKADYIVSEAKETADGYFIEAAIKWTSLKAAEGKLVGLDLQYNDAKAGKRIGTANWYDASGNGWSNPSVFGTAVLVKGNVVIAGDEKPEEPTKPSTSEQDTKAANAVIDKIKAIGTVSYDAAVKAKIDEARKAYDALTDAQKKLVPADVLKVLTDAETTYKAAEEEATKIEYFAKFSVKSIPLKVGQKSKVLAKDIQIAKGDKVVKWKTSNKKIVTVDKKGTIKGKKAGTATITAYTESGLKASIKVKVQKKKVAPTKITLTNKSTKKAIKSKGTVTLKKGKKLTVVANVKPMTCTEKVKFTSSNKKIATVSSKGVIKAKKPGKVTITAKVGKKTFKFKVKVVKK